MKFGKLAAGLALTTALGAFSAQAQEFKSTIRFIVPFGAGGATDVLARLVAPIVSKELGQTVIVENRAGANGQIGTQYVKSAPADGSVFLVTTEQPIQ